MPLAGTDSLTGVPLSASLNTAMICYFAESTPLHTPPPLTALYPEKLTFVWTKLRGSRSGEASDGREALVLALQLEPDVVVMDLSMPRMDGIETMRLLRWALPDVRILTLSQYDRPKVIAEAEKAGAAAFISKLQIWEKLATSLRRVHRGERFFENQEPESY
jgi:CheY-like chemotaxis protein